MKKIALIGNPNAGKSSLFNQLTGLNQKIGNFPGVTVDKKTGFTKLDDNTKIEIIDLPGTYSLYPKSLDERVVIDTLLQNEQKVDLVLVIADASSLKRNLLLFTQIKDLGIPTLFCLNMLDVAKNKGINIDIPTLEKNLGQEIIIINARKGKNINILKTKLKDKLDKQINGEYPYINSNSFAPEVLKQIKSTFDITNDYLALQYAHQGENLSFLSLNDKAKIQALKESYEFDTEKLQSKETLARYEIIEDIIKSSIDKKDSKQSFTDKIDQILTHKIFGYVFFLGVLFLIFQVLYTIADYPMGWIEEGFTFLQVQTKVILPEGAIANLLADGILAGLAGVLVFIPQIAFLFLFIAILEESGYMARVVFIMDKLMRSFGLNGKSVVPLISGMACAIPAIMATRTIESWKERFITIMVTPLMACSARLPVYTLLIALVIPNTYIFGIFNVQGLALMGLYLLGFFMAIFSAWVMKFILKSKEKSLLVMEIPSYKIPRWKNVGFTVWEKVKVFMIDAGKVILAISIVLWVLASYSPRDLEQVEKNIREQYKGFSEEKLAPIIASAQLEHSYIGIFGKFIEPTIEPLGYDWKIGIALITSFAAREVFVGTMSTIYSIGDEDEKKQIVSLKAKIEREVDPRTGKKVFDFATGISLLIFYAFAMQCMSTVAVVYRETKSWKLPLIQFFYMTGLAYICSLLVYQWLT